MEHGAPPDDQATPPEGFEPAGEGEEGFVPRHPEPLRAQIVVPRFPGAAVVLAILALVLLLWIGGESHYQSCVTRAAVNAGSEKPHDPDGCSIFPWSKPGD